MPEDYLRGYPEEDICDPCPGCVYEEDCKDPDICLIEEGIKEADRAERAYQAMKEMKKLSKEVMDEPSSHLGRGY